MRLKNIRRAGISFLLAVGMAGSGLTTIVVHADAPVNLVNNPSFETASSTDSTQPADWYPESWGTNTANFTYVNGGAHTGTYSVETSVSNYQSGDAKWLFNAVPVTAGDTYDYSDWYQSNAATNLWTQFTMQDGSLQYQWLKSTPTTSGWTESTASIVVPTGVTAMSVFHVLSSNGQLQMDDVNLADQGNCTPTYVNGLANGNFTQICASAPTIPVGWQTQTYGTDPVTYGDSASGYNGSGAVTIATTSTNDEAGWTTIDPTPAANQRYQLSFWQEGTTYVYAYVVETLTDGTTQPVSLMSAPATAGIFGTSTPVWSHYQDGFVTPANIQSMQIVLATSGEGNVSLSDVALNSLTNQTPTSFTNGMVSVTLDDDFADQYINGEPIMKTDDVDGTFYVNGSTLGTSGYMTNAQLKKTVTAGNEIASHMYHLSDMNELDTATLESEITGNLTDLHNILGSTYPITDFASPYGSYTSENVATAMQYAQSHRTTDGEMNTKANLDVNQIHAILVTPTTTLATVQSWITQAQTNHEWLVLVYHGITTTPSSDEEAQYAITPTQFSQQMGALKTSGIAVEPVNTALTTLLAQE